MWDLEGISNCCMLSLAPISGLFYTFIQAAIWPWVGAALGRGRGIHDWPPVERASLDSWLPFKLPEKKDKRSGLGSKGCAGPKGFHWVLCIPEFSSENNMLIRYALAQ